MKLEISSFADVGQLQKERIVLKASSDIDVGDYAIFRSWTRDGAKPTSGRKTAYWFPDGEVRAGDLVVLYTKKGQSSTKALDSGHTAHFFYWGLDSTLWDEGGHGACVLRVSEWKFRVP
jgi:hypothetical protein